ncbi:MAG: TonB-dependent receptor [Sphingomonadales bacterium]
MKVTKPFSLACIVLASTAVPALGEAAFPHRIDDEFIITATRTPTPLPQVGSAVSVISPLDIERRKPRFLLDLLPELPGVHFTQFGPPGSGSDIRIRGAEPSGTYVLIDGVEVADPSLIQNAFQFSHLLMGEVERVEVLRGSQSTLYGADAVGGVINIITRAGGGPLRQSARLEAGSSSSFLGSYTVSGGEGPVGFALGAQGFSTSGFSAADENDGNTEADGYDNISLTGKVSADLNENLSVSVNGRYSDSTAEYDGGFPLADADNEDDQMQFSGRTAARLTVMDGRFINDAAVSYTRTEREGRDSGALTGDFAGERLKFEYRGAFEVTDDQTLLFGAETKKEESTSLEQPDGRDARTSGFYAQYQLGLFDQLFLTGGVRIDDHSNFGTHDTYRVAASYVVPGTGTRLRSSYGTGFRAPSLYELYGECCALTVPLGNPGLEPEKSKSFDVGVEQSLLNDRLFVEATWFRLATDNKIEFDFANFGIAPAYVNVVGKTVSKGVELVGAAQVTETFSLRGTYTHMSVKGPNGQRLSYRPRNSFTVNADLDLLDGRANANVNLRRVSGVEELGTPMDNYTVVGGVVSYDLTGHVEVYARLQNVFDRQYQIRPGYGTADRSVYAGVRATF